MSEYTSRKYLGLDDLHSLCCLVKFSCFFSLFSLYNLICCIFFYHYMVNKDEYILYEERIVVISLTHRGPRCINHLSLGRMAMRRQTYGYLPCHRASLAATRTNVYYLMTTLGIMPPTYTRGVTLSNAVFLVLVSVSCS